MSVLATTAVLAVAFLSMGASSVAATPASPDKGLGCFVGDANGQYYFDADCRAHDVIKLDAGGNVEFYQYQDVGRLPDGAALPSSAIHSTYEQCIRFSFGVVCGTVSEIVTPGGVYTSTFRSH